MQGYLRRAHGPGRPPGPDRPGVHLEPAFRARPAQAGPVPPKLQEQQEGLQGVLRGGPRKADQGQGEGIRIPAGQHGPVGAVSGHPG